MSAFSDCKRDTWTAHRIASQGAAVSLVMKVGQWEASYECATKIAGIIGDRGLRELGDGIFESIPLLEIPTLDLFLTLKKLTPHFSIALLEYASDGTSGQFSMIWKIPQDVKPIDPYDI